MYLPDGNVMPAYSTWQPTEGKIPPTASADHSATRRLVAPRGDLMRGNPIASTLLGVSGGPSDPFLEGGSTAVGSPSFPIPPNRLRQSFQAARSLTSRAGSSRPHGAVVGLLTRLWNRPNQPPKPNDSCRFDKIRLDHGVNPSFSFGPRSTLP